MTVLDEHIARVGVEVDEASRRRLFEGTSELERVHAGRGLDAELEAVSCSPKNGRVRYVPLTERLFETHREYRHPLGPRVLCKDDGQPLSRQSAWTRVWRAVRLAGVPTGVHILRHTFCSHLAMQGASGKAIQELAGHKELSMTQRYMHLRPAALDAAIQLLDGRGNIVATEAAASANING